MQLDHLDLTSMTREGMVSLIHVGKYDPIHWLTLGEIQIGEELNRGERLVGAYLNQEATNFEESSAWAFRFPVVGLKFDAYQYGVMSFTGYIGTAYDTMDRETFSFPSPDYDPFEGSEECETCQHSHRIVKSYLPPLNLELYKLLQGQYIRISTHPG